MRTIQFVANAAAVIIVAILLGPLLVYWALSDKETL